MDENLGRDKELVIDIESCRTSSEEVGSTSPDQDGKQAKTALNGENGVNLVGSVRKGGEISPESVAVLINTELEGAKTAVNPVEKNKMRNERRKTTSAKKPPRPPRGLSLDTADQKLIKEIAELAMLKRARIERMKALKKMKTAKASSGSSSSGSFFAMLFTVLFCLVIAFQGMSCRNHSLSRVHGSPESAGSLESLIMVQYHKTLAPNHTNSTGSESPKRVEQVSGLDPEIKEKRATG